MKQVLIALLLWPCILQAQKTQNTLAPIKKVTVFKEGAQIEHQQQLNLSAGKQVPNIDPAKILRKRGDPEYSNQKELRR
jgi:hypothetical protein